ncbi:MAG: ATP-binding protein, partial [Eubacteriales bacterium]|nr:ATP-binding protein [Eubacteriales bacterium]
MKKLRHSIGRSSVKEAFDNLPSGICNFDKRGIPVLVNRKMDRLSFDLMGHDLQYEEEFAKAVSELKDGLFHEENGSIWEFQKNEIEGLGVEYIATDVTKIYEDNQILEEKNRELKEMARVLEETSRNIVA